MGFRLILAALAVIAVVLILRHLYRQQTALRTPPTKVGVDMVKCAHSGLHLPRAEALGNGEQFFCSEKHREASRSDGH